MSAIQKVRQKFGNLGEATDRTDRNLPEVLEIPKSGTDKADRSPSVSSVSAIPRKVEKLNPALAERIRAMGARWQYSPEDLADALSAAHIDPAGWLAAAEQDEAFHLTATRAGMKYPC